MEEMKSVPVADAMAFAVITTFLDKMRSTEFANSAVYFDLQKVQSAMDTNSSGNRKATPKHPKKHINKKKKKKSRPMEEDR